MTENPLITLVKNLGASLGTKYLVHVDDHLQNSLSVVIPDTIFNKLEEEIRIKKLISQHNQGILTGVHYKLMYADEYNNTSSLIRMAIQVIMKNISSTFHISREQDLIQITLPNDETDFLEVSQNLEIHIKELLKKELISSEENINFEIKRPYTRYEFKYYSIMDSYNQKDP